MDLRHSRSDTTVHECVQPLPESVRVMVGSVYLMLAKGKEEKMAISNLPQNAVKASGEVEVSC